MTTITAKFPDSLSVKIAAEARQRRISKSQILREMAEQRYKANGHKKPKVTAYDLVKKACGTIKGGPRDLATNPKYMEGFGD